MKRVLQLCICLITVFICCSFVFCGQVSAISYIKKADKENIEKLLSETPAVDGNCNEIHITEIGEDGVETNTTISLVTFTDSKKVLLSDIERQSDGSYIERKSTADSYIGDDFYIMETDYRFKEYIDIKSRRVILDNIKYAFNNIDYGISAEAKHMFYNEIRSFYGDDVEYVQGEIIGGIQPNMFLAYEIFLPFKGVVGTIFGCICWIIIVSLVFSVIIDFMYMQVPEFRERTYQFTQHSSGGRFSFIKNRSKIDRPWFVSYEAARASKESIESNGERNMMILYLKYRVVTWIIVTICLTYLLTGLFMGIMNVIWEKAPQVFDVATWGA